MTAHAQTLPAIHRRWIRAEPWLVALVLLLHVWMAASVSPNFGPTGDENAHLTGGYTYWLHNDYRLHSENGNLAQRWVALPLLALRVPDPCLDSAGWAKAAYWEVSPALFFSRGTDLPRMLQWTRFTNALLGGAITLLVFIWSKHLFGRPGAWLSLLLAAFCPHLLAHAGFANSDIAISLAFLFALLVFWRLLHRLTPLRITVAGLGVGALLTTKFSGVFFVPIALALLLIRILHPAALPVSIGAGLKRLRGQARVLPLVGAAIATALIAFVFIWAVYGFRYSATPAGVTPEIWQETFAYTQHRGGGVSEFAEFGRKHRLLPEAWLHGLEYVKWHAGQRRAFLSGDHRTDGWREFFPVAFLIKTTLGALLLIALASMVLVLGKRRRRWPYRLAPLLVFIGVFGFFAVSSRINIGHRHILPLYPALYILAGASVWALRSSGRRALVLIAAPLLAWHIGASLSVRPHYLAYFNELIGGPRQGYRYLVDSSLDWGQNLAGLKHWLDGNRGDKTVYLSYFGGDRPSRLHLDAVRTGDWNLDPDTNRNLVPHLRGGIYCISATALQQVYTPLFGLWSLAAERRYHYLRSKIENPGVSLTPDELDVLRYEFDYTRFGRLCHFLRQRDADSHVGYSILIYNLSDSDIEAFLNSPLPIPPNIGPRP
jgi:hypothetical protein